MRVPQFLAKFKKDPLPTFASFVLFTIDPIETVKFLNDPEALVAASGMPPKQYLAYVHKNCSWDRTQPDLVYDIILISGGLPSRDEENGVEPDMCTPIAPATYHPNGRKPVLPSKPLPINNCYFHSKTVVKTVKAKNVWRRFDDAIIMRGPDRYREYLTAGDDQNRSELLKCQYQYRQRMVVDDPPKAEAGIRLSVIQEESEKPELVPWPAIVEESTKESDTARGGDVDVEPTRDAEETLELPTMLPSILAQGFADESMIAIKEITYDLSGGNSFSQPEKFIEDEAFLKRIISESKERAIQRAQQVDQAKYGDRSAREIAETTAVHSVQVAGEGEDLAGSREDISEIRCSNYGLIPKMFIRRRGSRSRAT